MYGNSFFYPNMYSRMGLSKGLFSNLFKNFSLSGFLSGTSKTLNVINQAIPIYYQVKPIISNAKTMFKVMNAVKSEPEKTPKTTTNITKQVKENPTFFI